MRYINRLIQRVRNPIIVTPGRLMLQDARAEGWREAVWHLENHLDKETFHAAMKDNPYGDL